MSRITSPFSFRTPQLTTWLTLACLTVGAADALAGATWSAATVLATSSKTTDLLQPAIAANGTGRKLAVWIQDGQIQVRPQENGVWGATTAVSLATLGVATPTVTLAEDGKAVVAWVQNQSGGQSTLEASFYSNGQWSLPITVSNAGITVTSPKVGVSATGQATLAWAEADGTGVQCAVQTASGTTDSGWSLPQTLASTCHSMVSLSVNGAGEALAGWGDLDFLTGQGVYVATRDAAGTWSPAKELMAPQYRQYLPAFSLGEDGTAVAVWANAYTGLMYSRKRPGSDWSPVATAYAGIYSITTLSDVAVDGQGNATAAFQIWNMLPSGAIAYPLQAVQLKNTSSTWSKPAYVTAKNQNIYNFTVEASPGGSVAVAWSDSSKSGVASMLPGETRWSNATLGKGGYEVALDMATGNASVLWNSATMPGNLYTSSAVAP